MALVNCPECNKEISEKAKACPNCGFELIQNQEIQSVSKPVEKSSMGCFPIIIIVGSILILILIFSGSNSNSGRASKNTGWYSGGNLHSATVKEWRAATEANKLATSGDMAMVNKTIKARVMNSSDINNALPYARQMMTCIDEAAGPGVSDKIKINELAAACLILFNWQ